MYGPYSWKRTVAPKEQALTLGEVKNWLRIDDDLTDDDTQIKALIEAVAGYTENTKGLCLTTQKWTLYLDEFPCEIEIYKRPVISVDAVKYLDADGATQTLAALNYLTDLTAFVPRICPAYGYSWPTIGRYQSRAVQVELTLGYGAAGAVPQQVKAGMCLLIAHLYENRENTTAASFELKEIPIGYHHLVSSEAIVYV